MEKLACVAQAFAWAWFRSQPQKFHTIVGDVGCGKTHVSKKIAFWAQRVAYERWQRTKLGSDLPTVLFSSARILSPESYKEDAFREKLAEMAGASMVIIDDIGTETDQFKTGIPARRLAEIMNLLEGRFLWMTTNIPAGSWSQRWDKRVEDRILSGVVVNVNAPSYRSEQV